MEISEDQDDGVVTVAPAGRIDSNTSDEIEARLFRRLDSGARRVVVDLGRVEYISSAGLRVLLRAGNRMRAEGGNLVLCGLGRSVREVFELSGFTSLFAIEDSREPALARVRGAG